MINNYLSLYIASSSAKSDPSSLYALFILIPIFIRFNINNLLIIFRNKSKFFLSCQLDGCRPYPYADTTFKVSYSLAKFKKRQFFSWLRLQSRFLLVK